MRILLILLIAGLCLVTAKYIPLEESDKNILLHRVRRSDSDSNTASVERDDDSSNENENESDDDNESLQKKIKEEQDKRHEKEEKKKQKLLEKMEKEKIKNNEEKQKLENNLAKEKRKIEERKEKEERKLAEKVEKENRKLEEEKKKKEEKLEKEERKRQEKLKKQLEKIQKDQIESNEDGYLETEEEDSLEMEDIWKAYVYDKYGITVTSTKLERQSALRRYLQEEMGINSNSTKSERRQAILKLIQTKLHNDSATVDSFRNLLVSHVNAAQIQKLRTKLESDLAELDNQTQLLNNVSLPWVSVAQQSIEEKRTFLQAIGQFLSNIVPNWLTGSESSITASQVNGNETPSSTGIPSDLPNIPASGSGQSSLPVESVNNGSSNDINADGETNFNVLPSDVGSGSPLNNLSNNNVPSGNGASNNNLPVSESEFNELPSNSGNSPSTLSSNSPSVSGPNISTNNLSESDFPENSNVNNNKTNVPVLETNVDESPSDSLDNPESSDTSVSTNPDLSSRKPSEGSDTVNDNIHVSQTNNNALPLNVDTTINSDLLNKPTSSNSGSTSGNPSESNVLSSNNSINDNIPVAGNNGNSSKSANVDTANTPILSDTGILASNTGKPNLPEDSGLLPSKLDGSEVSENNDTLGKQTDSNGLSPNSGNIVNSGSASTSSSVSDYESTLSSLLEPIVSSSSLSNNNVNAVQNDVNGLPSSIADEKNVDAIPDSKLSPSNTLDPGLSEINGSLNDKVIATLTNISEVQSATNLEKNTSNSSDSLSGGVLNNNDLAEQNNGQTTNIDSLNNFAPSNQQAIAGSGSSQSNLIQNTESIDVTSLNNNEFANQASGNGIFSSIDNSAKIESSNVPLQIDVNSLIDNNNSVTSAPINDNTLVTSNDINELNSNTGISGSVDSSLHNDALISYTNINALPSNTESSATVDFPNVQSPVVALQTPQADETTSDSSKNLNDNSTSQGDSINEPVEETAISFDSVPSLPSKSSNDPIHSDVSLGNPPSSGTTGNSVTTAVQSPNSENDKIVPTETIMVANSIDETVKESNSVSSNSYGITEGNDGFELVSNDGSTNMDSIGFTVHPNPVEDNINLVENEVVPSESEISNPESTVLFSEPTTEKANNTFHVTDKTSLGISTESSSNLSNSTDDIIDSATTESVVVINGPNLGPYTGSDVTFENNLTGDLNPVPQNPNLINTEATTITNEDSVTSKDQNVDLLNTPEATKETIFQVEPQTEQGILGVQEIVNTPSDFVTVASGQPPEDVSIPNETAATFIDVKLQ